MSKKGTYLALLLSPVCNKFKWKEPPEAGKKMFFFLKTIILYIYRLGGSMIHIAVYRKQYITLIPIIKPSPSI